MQHCENHRSELRIPGAPNARVTQILGVINLFAGGRKGDFHPFEFLRLLARDYFPANGNQKVVDTAIESSDDALPNAVLTTI